MKYLIIAASLVFLFSIIPTSLAVTYYDLDLIDLQVLDIQVLSMDDTPDYPKDDTDLVKITVSVANNGLDYFVVRDKMFKIHVMEYGDNYEAQAIVDNYFTVYDDELEVRYDNLDSRELFNECDYTNSQVRIGQSKTFTICFDVLRIWNNEVLDINGQKKHYLVMMDNHQATSCPNCKKILLTKMDESETNQPFPKWVQDIVMWYLGGIISEEEFKNSMNYLETKGIIPYVVSSGAYTTTTLEEKNSQLKEHQARLVEAQKTNLYVSLMNFYESKHSDAISGVLCKQQNNIVTLSGDYANEDDVYYNSIFFKLLVFDDFGNIIATGFSKIVDVTHNDFRHFEVSTPYKGRLNYCSVIVDAKFALE